MAVVMRKRDVQHQFPGEEEERASLHIVLKRNLKVKALLFILLLCLFIIADEPNSLLHKEFISCSMFAFCKLPAKGMRVLCLWPMCAPHKENFSEEF